MNINEHAKYYKSLSLFFLLPFLPQERLVASPEKTGLGVFFSVTFFDVGMMEYDESSGFEAANNFDFLAA